MQSTLEIKSLAEIDNDVTLSRVRAEIERTGLTQGQVAREANISATTLTQLLNGTYNADPGRQLTKLEKWLAAQAEKNAAPIIPTAPDWVETPTANRVFLALGYAQKFNDLTVIYGAAGLGKTATCKAYRKSISSVWLATMTPSTSSVASCLDEVCVALGIKNPPSSALRMQREVLRKITGTKGLLIIDEAQHLSTPALDALRSLHDAAEIGLALVGNEAIYASMTGGNRAPYLDRLYSRIGKRVKLTRATKSDVLSLAMAMGVNPEDKKALEFLVEIGNKSGALRSVVKVIRLATMEAAGKQPELSHIKAAWRELSHA